MLTRRRGGRGVTGNVSGGPVVRQSGEYTCEFEEYWSGKGHVLKFQSSLVRRSWLSCCGWFTIVARFVSIPAPLKNVFACPLPLLITTSIVEGIMVGEAEDVVDTEAALN